MQPDGQFLQRLCNENENNSQLELMENWNAVQGQNS
jgi:hypothetical protein